MKNCRFYSDPFLASQKRLPWVGIFATKAVALKSTFEKSEWSCLASELKLLIKLLTFDGLKDTKLKICKLLMSKLQVGFYMYTYYLSPASELRWIPNDSRHVFFLLVTSELEYTEVYQMSWIGTFCYGWMNMISEWHGPICQTSAIRCQATFQEGGLIL